MLIAIPDVLSKEDARSLGRRIAAAQWVDGNATSGAGAAMAKRNRQLPEEADIAAEARRIVTAALARSAPFLSAALPRRIYPPLFNAYGVGEFFRPHVDNAIRVDPATGEQMRTDLSATLFLCDPEDYDGGELTIEGNFGEARYRLPAGHMLLYPSTSLHRVTEVTRGQRTCCFFWVQSLVGDGEAREMLFNLDSDIQDLAAERGLDDERVLSLTALYHNLVRRWTR